MLSNRPFPFCEKRSFSSLFWDSLIIEKDINCDYLLSDYLQWPMYDTKRENPFRPYFELWKMGLNIYFPERGRVVLIG